MPAPQHTWAAKQNETSVRTLELLLRMRGDLLEALRPLLVNLIGMGDESFSDSIMHRLAKRVYCVQRYRELRRSPEHRHLSQRRLIALVNRDAARIDRTWACSRQAIQAWIQA